MSHYTNFIMKHRKWVIGLFIVAAILCGLLSQFVKVNYEFADYLPEDAKSTKAIDVMSSEYKQSIPNARVLLYDVSIANALAYKNQIAALEGVEEIIWLDDAVSIYEPLEMAPKELVDTWYKENHAIFTVTIDKDMELETVNAIRAIIGEENCMAGSVVTDALAPMNTENEIKRIMFVVLPIILVVLLLTTTSWFEPFLFLFTIGIAIVLNSGTNLMFGTISFVTNAAGSVLQLAVSMDYSIFLLHRFADNRKAGFSTEEAMKNAVKQSMSAILSSGLTTVTGFAALILMRFQIGPDMGFVMAKAILFSLISVLCLLPVLAVATCKLIDRTEHKSFVPSFYGFSRLIYRMKVPMVAIFLLLLVPSFLASRSNTFLYGGSKIYTTEETQMGRDLIAIEELYGSESQAVLLVKKGDMEKEIALNGSLQNIDGITSIISYVNTVGESIPVEFLPTSQVSQLFSENYSRFVLSLDIAEGKENWASLVDEIRATAQSYYGEEFHFAGDLVSTEDLKITITADDIKVNLLAIIFVFLILIVTFRSITIPIILTLVIEASIWINLSVPYFAGSSLYYIGYLIISSVQLGATIDYAILLTERYKEKRATLPKKEAILESIRTCTISIFTSAFILSCAGTTLGVISTNAVLSQLGILLGRGAALSFLLVLFVLPIFLVVFDRWIGYTTIGWPRDHNIVQKHSSLKMKEKEE